MLIVIYYLKNVDDLEAVDINIRWSFRDGDIMKILWMIIKIQFIDTQFLFRKETIYTDNSLVIFKVFFWHNKVPYILDTQPVHDVRRTLLHNVFLTFGRCYNVHKTLFRRHVPAGYKILKLAEVPQHIT